MSPAKSRLKEWGRPLPAPGPATDRSPENGSRFRGSARPSMRRQPSQAQATSLKTTRRRGGVRFAPKPAACFRSRIPDTSARENRSSSLPARGATVGAAWASCGFSSGGTSGTVQDPALGVVFCDSRTTSVRPASRYECTWSVRHSRTVGGLRASELTRIKRIVFFFRRRFTTSPVPSMRMSSLSPPTRSSTTSQSSVSRMDQDAPDRVARAAARPAASPGAGGGSARFRRRFRSPPSVSIIFFEPRLMRLFVLSTPRAT
mmetsp:Transcript_2919/g.9956  ORF Transcript_2919/g.9956 Transcript_2919/m.9956 type:complete len:260 (+) Transcript_2919:239-1018(+)